MTTLLADVREAVEEQLPERMLELITITIMSDPYFIAPRVLFTPRRKPELVVEARLDHEFRIPKLAIAEICLWA
jgi:hypothetical protein